MEHIMKTENQAPALSKCLQCGRKMPLFLFQQDKKHNLTTRSTSIARLDPDGIFCTLRCAAAYGVHAAVGGA
jgi:hypothetical protein